MPELQELGLKCIQGLEQCPPEAFSALTSSSMLEMLTWETWSLFERDQPGPWQHMFQDTQQWSALTALVALHAMTWVAPDLDRLVSSCSQLECLYLRCSPGLQLTALTQLWLRGVSEESTVASLVQLSALQGLQELSVLDPCSFTEDAVRSLTALTQLTRLALSDMDGVFSTTMQQQLLQHSYKEEVAGPAFTCHIMENTAPAGAPPDVWSQLLSCCEDCAQATQQHMAEPDAAVEQQQEEEAAPAALQQAIEAPPQLDQVPAGVPPAGGGPLAEQQHWQRWQLFGAAVALMAVAVPMLLLFLQSLGLPAA